MELTDIRVILMVLAVVSLVYFFFNRDNTVQNEGSLENEHMEAIDMDDDDTMENLDVEDYDSMDDDDNHDDVLDRKINSSRNSVPKGSGYKTVNYKNGERGQRGSWEDNFDAGNAVIPTNEHTNDTFAPNESSNNNYASFQSSGNSTCGSNQDCEPEDLFDADKMLPQEVNDDWYQVLPEPVSVKNRHLINVTRPIGVNTIGNSTKNASYDIRGTIPNPRTVVSPFLNSSIEPDHNIRPCLC
uniref:Minor capsid protein P11 C-terminal conserved region domain-containing protein n=1 Tax=viral metagenome TaxID=1070528 RepID=A0A6C0ABZ0_9ZZZZ